MSSCNAYRQPQRAVAVAASRSRTSMEAEMRESPTIHSTEAVQNPDNPKRLIGIKELSSLLGCRKSKIYADLASHVLSPENPMPRPVKLGRNTRWVLGEVEAYIAGLVAQRDLAKEVGQ